ncbi:MAG: DUF4112 domain-containing protein, partial [Verrucomicrobiales bacterium]|nr:DUF4112 domain-containing protein [Verrucomicrobiales bacterium]
AGVGTIPVVGDLFSVWFKSNSRNYRMLNTWMESEDGDEERGGWWPVLFVFFIIGTVIVLNIVSWILMSSAIAWIFRGIAGAMSGAV